MNVHLAPASLLSLSTANPPYVFKQNDVLEAASRIFASKAMSFARLGSIFENTGILQRHSVCPMDWFDEKRGWKERNEIYIDGAMALFGDVAGQALEKAALKPADIDTIVTVSSTGIATPTIEARVMADMGFEPNTRRVPVFGLGCAGGVSGLSIASRLAAADPGSNVLLVVIELCTLAFRDDEVTKSNIIASALFGDGAAAAVFSSREQNAICQIEATGEHTWPDTLDIMGWKVDDVGLGAIFDRSIPQLVRERLGPAADGFLADNQLTRNDLNSFVFHPGGTKVLEALEATFELGQGALQSERKVLAENGNMSAPTVLFVLGEAIEQGLTGRSLVSALGPGFSSSFATLVA